MSDSAVAAAEPHQQDQPQPQDATTPARAEAESSENSTALVAQTNSTGTELVDAGSSSGSGSGGADKFLPHVERVYRSSETRTPVVLALSDGDPFYTVAQLARREGCAVWSITMGSERNERNALDYVEVGTQNGDWVYLTNVEAASPEVLRNIALTLYTLKPEPKQFPRRHLFRLVLVTAQHVDVTNTIKPVLPQAMLQNALIARAHMPSGVRAEGASPEKIQRRMPVDKPLYEVAVEKHRVRRDAGRDSDSESDAEEPEKKATGMWFHRSVDFYEVDEGSTVSRVNELIFDAVEKEKVDQITELANSGRLNIDQVIRDGMNPLMWAVSRAKVASAKALIAAGADVHVRRESDSCPLLFMCIESEDLITALVEAGANIDERFEGYRLETHPTTMPHIAAMVRDAKGLPQQKTSALDLAATLNNTKLPSDI